MMQCAPQDNQENNLTSPKKKRKIHLLSAFSMQGPQDMDASKE